MNINKVMELSTKRTKSRKRIYNSCSCGRCDFQGGFIPDKESIQKWPTANIRPFPMRLRIRFMKRRR